MSPEPDSDRADWVVLLDGVRVSHRWMTRHTPRLLAAWCAADSVDPRAAIAARILRAATELESEPVGDDADPWDGGQIWRSLAEHIDPRLVHGPDWPPLAAALDRAHTAGYDVETRLPTLAAAGPLPDRHPARELHWRLLDDCPPQSRHAMRPTALPKVPAMDTARPAVHRSALTPPSTGGGDAPSSHRSPRPEEDQA